MYWSVFRENPKTKVIETFNIFTYNNFYQDIQNIFKNSSNMPFGTFVKNVDRALAYNFKNKPQWQVKISSNDETKVQIIDVYSQIKPNFEYFIEYLYSAGAGS